MIVVLAIDAYMCVILMLLFCTIKTNPYEFTQRCRFLLHVVCIWVSENEFYELLVLNE